MFIIQTLFNLFIMLILWLCALWWRNRESKSVLDIGLMSVMDIEIVKVKMSWEAKWCVGTWGYGIIGAEQCESVMVSWSHVNWGMQGCHGSEEMQRAQDRWDETGIRLIHYHLQNYQTLVCFTSCSIIHWCKFCRQFKSYRNYSPDISKTDLTVMNEVTDKVCI